VCGCDCVSVSVCVVCGCVCGCECVCLCVVCECVCVCGCVCVYGLHNFLLASQRRLEHISVVVTNFRDSCSIQFTERKGVQL